MFEIFYSAVKALAFLAFIFFLFAVICDIAGILRNMQNSLDEINELFCDILTGAPDAQEIDYSAEDNQDNQDSELYFEAAIENPYPGRQKITVQIPEMAKNLDPAFMTEGDWRNAARR